MKKKESILREIIIIFIVLILVVILIAAVGEFFFSQKVIERRSKEQVTNVAQLVESLFVDLDINYLKNNKEAKIYKEAREGIRKICQTFNLEYLYILIKNEKKDSFQYVIAAAAEDNNDKIVSERVKNDPSIKFTEGNDSSSSHKEYYESAFGGNITQKGININNKYGNVYTWFYPVLDKNKKVKYAIGVDYKVERVTYTVIRNTIVLFIPIMVVSLILLLIEVSVLQRKVFKPIKIISQKMNSFLENREKDSAPLEYVSNNEIKEISDSFNKMSDEINNYINHIEKLTKERAESEVQLEIAKKIQYGIVPSKFSEIDEKYNAFACAFSAKYVGGDFYDCFKLENGNVCIVIGDVSGKGITAALFMTMAKTVLRELLIVGKKPSEALFFANNELCRSNPESMFVTVFTAILDVNTGILSYSNAGHNKPVILGDSIEFLSAKNGVVLGFMEDSDFVEEQIQLKKNQGILLYTDGVTEAINPKEEFYGNKRLLETLQNNFKDKYNSEEVVELVKNNVFDYYQNMDLYDDLTLLSLIYT